MKILPFPKYELTEEEYQKVKHGNAFTPTRWRVHEPYGVGSSQRTPSKPAKGKIILTFENALVALAEVITGEGDIVKPLKVMVK